MSDKGVPSIEQPDGPVRFMQHLLVLDYEVRTSPLSAHFAKELKAGRILGRKCPSCGRVYVPPRGWCALCTVAMTEAHELELPDQGTVTAFTLITPIQYHGQEEKEPYALASIILDGADITIGQARIRGIPIDQVRSGMRVKAVWRDPDDRGGGDDRMGVGIAIKGWEPTGEPDVDHAHYKEHIL